MKLVFDATFGETWVIHLRDFFQNHSCPRPEIRHLFEIAGEDERDDLVWVPKLANLGCVVVSGDRGTHSKPCERLPRICRDQHVTHILLSAGMHDNAHKFEKARAIIILWHEIIAACQDAPGSRYLIQAMDGSFTRFALVKKST